jgi:3-phenylpropionate/cinnamic acid dioxygenase small subunit
MEPDHVVVTNLLYRYAELVDLGDFEGVGRLLADAVVTVEGVPGVQRGATTIQSVLEGWTRRYPDGTPRTAHVLTNPIVEVDDERGTATIRSRYTVFQQTDELALQPIIAGRYHDRFEKVDGEWRFAARHLFTDLQGDLGHHLLQGLPPASPVPGAQGSAHQT